MPHVRPTLGPAEEVKARAGAQLSAGFPQTAGTIYLTNRRLVLVPDQLASLGCGRPLEIRLTDISWTKTLGRFQGGTFVGGAGKKILVALLDGTEHTFSFYLTSDIDGFYAALERLRGSAIDEDGSSFDASSGRPFPKPHRSWLFWLMVIVAVAAVVHVLMDTFDLVRHW
jgi:hypothetical protein